MNSCIYGFAVFLTFYTLTGCHVHRRFQGKNSINNDIEDKDWTTLSLLVNLTCEITVNSRESTTVTTNCIESVTGTSSVPTRPDLKDFVDEIAEISCTTNVNGTSASSVAIYNETVHCNVNSTVNVQPSSTQHSQSTVDCHADLVMDSNSSQTNVYSNTKCSVDTTTEAARIAQVSDCLMAENILTSKEGKISGFFGQSCASVIPKKNISEVSTVSCTLDINPQGSITKVRETCQTVTTLPSPTPEVKCEVAGDVTVDSSNPKAIKEDAVFAIRCTIPSTHKLSHYKTKIQDLIRKSTLDKSRDLIQKF